MTAKRDEARFVVLTGPGCTRCDEILSLVREWKVEDLFEFVEAESPLGKEVSSRHKLAYPASAIVDRRTGRVSYNIQRVLRGL